MTSEFEGRELVSRHLREHVEEALADTPVVVIQGARQTGKSTLVKQILASRGGPLRSLDVSIEYEAASADPDAYVRRGSDAVVAIDEVQRVPRLIRAIKAAVDSDRKPGRFLITGSADLLRIPGTEESLAGRAETVELYGLSQGEVRGTREVFIDRTFIADEGWLAERGSGLVREDYLDIVCAGSYPEAMLRRGRRRDAWLDNYLSRTVSADARDIARFAHLDRLSLVVELLAACNAGELVNARLADATGIPQASIPQYIDLLESLYVIHRLPAWGGNLTRRVVGRPKVALLDTGLAARLINVTPDALAPGRAPQHAGGLVEAFVAGELRRQLGWSDRSVRMGHFRDRNGAEVDIVLEDASRDVVGVEVKVSTGVGSGDFRGLRLLAEKLGRRFRCGVVLHTGPDAVRFGENLWALPLSSLWEPN